METCNLGGESIKKFSLAGSVIILFLLCILTISGCNTDETLPTWSMHGNETLDLNRNLNQEYILQYRGKDVAKRVVCHLSVTLNSNTIYEKDFTFDNMAFEEKVELKNIIDVSKTEGYNFSTPNHQTKIIIEWVDSSGKKNTEEIEVTT
jgi:hypothetical protein